LSLGKDICEESMTFEIDKSAVVKTYGRWAPVYDIVFGSVFEQARRAGIEASDRVSGRILELGVGTGISLPEYSRSTRIVGIDLSEKMLRKARERVLSLKLDHVEDLLVMDAERLTFPDGSFDVVVAQYVVNTVPNPNAVLRECARVLRPGGEIILINRIGAEDGARRTFEKLFQPMAQRLGWRSEFPWQHFERWMESNPDIHLIERRPVPPMGHFSLIRFGKHGPDYQNASGRAN
jgi:phosphatidylethanolamine/phosphatidyl-N-methylethanolamine N-methyltransferase